MSAAVPSSLSSAIRRDGSTGRLLDVCCRAERNARPYPETHGAWTVALVRRGTFNYRAGDTNQTYALRPGWVLLGRPGQHFECSHEQAGGDECLALDVTAEVVEQVASATPGCSGSPFPAPVLAPMTRLAALMAGLSAGGPDFDEAVLSIVATAMAHAHGSPPAALALHAASRARVADSLERIERTSHERLELAALAREADLSPYHFLRVFRGVTGTTPHQYVLGVRLRRAAQLLVDSSRPVTAIAYEVGFADLSNFIRTFHKTVGCSPRSFRARATASRARTSKA